ncbi:MAG: ATPase domain-containing protein [Nitrososphaerales archaeon]|jgi:circadian clock protein KaiC
MELKKQAFPTFGNVVVQPTTPRVPTAIPGLDPLIQGGLQRGDFVLLSGGVGAGKTTFSCQFAYNGAMFLNEPAVFATFEEDSDSLKRNMLKFGMDLESLEKEGKMRVLDLEILEGQGMGSNMEVLLSALDKIHGKRLVVDSLTAFLTGAKDKFDYRFLMHLVYKTLKREGVMTMMTVSRSDDTRGSITGMGVEEFVADGIFQLESYVSDAMELKTRFLVRKLRGCDHSRKYHSVAFTQEGVHILPWSS